MAPESKEDLADKKERIAKRMARAGLCSRRQAEQWILDGRVQVNGKVLDSPAFSVCASDNILVDGKALPGEEKIMLFLHHKPAGLVTTHKDEKGRSTVFDNLPPGLPRLISVGRLDLNTEGLLLLTNDGELARYLELPSTGWKRKYKVRVFGTVKQAALDRLAKGVTLEGVQYAPIEATIDTSDQDRPGQANTWINVSLREGKNREIRKVMESLGLKVNRLIRTDYGPFSLGKLESGAVRPVEDQVLRHQLAKFFKERMPSSDEPKSDKTKRKRPPARGKKEAH